MHAGIYSWSVVALVVGFSVAFITWQQWQIARNKLRLDLFDRRYKVFEATRRFLAGIVSAAKFEDSQLFEFYADTADAEFLFGSDIVEYLTHIRKRAVDMRMHQKIFEPLPVGADRTRHVEAAHKQLLWLSEQLTAVSHVFVPYLGFSHIK